MTELKSYVFIGLIFGVVGGLVGYFMAMSGNMAAAINSIYLFGGIAGIIITWGFAEVFDEINDNTRRVADLMESLVDEQGDEEEAVDSQIIKKDKPKIVGPGSTMSTVEIKSVIMRYAHETYNVDELAELLIVKYPGLTKERVQECVAELEQEERGGGFRK